MTAQPTVYPWTDLSATRPNEFPFRRRRARTDLGQTQPVAARRSPPGETIGGLLQDLSGRSQRISDAEIGRAAELLQAIVHSERPALAVAEHLGEIDGILPALLELNIRQAQADGRPDLAQALTLLLQNIHLQMGSAAPRAPALPDARPQPRARTRTARPRVLFVGPPDMRAPWRQALPAQALAGTFCETLVATRVPLEHLDRFDVIIAHHPHADLGLMEDLVQCQAAGIPIVLDLDLDPEQLPLAHPASATLGLGTRAHADAYGAALRMARWICVPSEALASTLRSAGLRVRVVPDSWGRQESLWDQPAPGRHTIHLGWLGAPGQVEDAALLRRPVLRILREFPQTRLVVAGDPQVYQLFDRLPDSRRLYLPPAGVEDQAYLLSQFDILMVPLRNTPFNHTLSDRRVVEAGAQAIPWVASPTPAHAAWLAGGLLANTSEDWHNQLRTLVLDPDLRSALGRAGRRRADEREAGRVAAAWLELVHSALPEP